MRGDREELRRRRSSSRSDSPSRSESRGVRSRSLRTRSASRSRSRGAREGHYGTNSERRREDGHSRGRRRRYSSGGSMSRERSESRNVRRRGRHSRSSSTSPADRQETSRYHHEKEVDPFGRDRPMYDMCDTPPGSPETAGLRDVVKASLRSGNSDRDGCDVVDQTTTVEDVIASIVVKRIKSIIETEVKAYVESSEYRTLVETLRRRERERALEAVQKEVRAEWDSRMCSICSAGLSGSDGASTVRGGVELRIEGSASSAGYRLEEAPNSLSTVNISVEDSYARALTDQKALEERLREVQKKHEEETRCLRAEEELRVAQVIPCVCHDNRPEKLSFGIKKRTTMW